MALKDFFKGKQPVEVTPLELGERAENLMSMMELMNDPQLIAKMEAEHKNMVDSSSYFQAFENADDTGNYFGSEFNIRATAGRIKSSYTKEPWMYATANLIAKSLSLVPMVVQDAITGEPLENHPLNAKIKAGNRFQDGDTLAWCGQLDLVLGGNFFRVYDEFFNESMQVPVELCSLVFDPNSRRVTSLKIWDNKLGTYLREVPYNQVVHFKLPNPFNPFYGMSLYIAASRPMVMDRAMQEFQMAFYLRGATNTGVIETTEDINRKRMQRLMRTFEQVYTGKRNWWRTIFLPKGAKWVKSSLSMSEMLFYEGLKENRLTFLAAIGVPPSKVGIVQDVNRSTSEVQDETFWENTIKPLAGNIAAGWNSSYLVSKFYAGRVKVVPDFSGIQALNGDLISKGEQAKAIEPYYLIDEIRAKVFKEEALPEGKGQKFVAEIKAVSPGGFGALGLAAPQQAPTTPPQAASPAGTPNDPIEEATEVTAPNDQANPALAYKAGAVASQDRIEKKLGVSFLRGYAKYQDKLFEYTEYALRKGLDVKTFLASKQAELAKVYGTNCEEDLYAAMQRGFSFANAQAKAASGWIHVKAGNQSGQKTFARISKATRFNETDREAIDYLRREQEPDKREALLKRSIENFLGFNETDTNKIVSIVATGLEENKTTDQIAASIRADYEEKYSSQSSTIARTEILSAISEGTKWNHDILGTVFSDVQKQWFHVGDGNSNPHARQNHVEFEGEGVVPSDHKWGGMLDYPRDPAGGAEEVINCRCTMVSVVPDNATSNADAILASE